MNIFIPAAKMLRLVVRYLILLCITYTQIHIHATYELDQATIAHADLEERRTKVSQARLLTRKAQCLDLENISDVDVYTM